MSKESIKKITLADFIARKEQSQRDKRTPKTDELYIESLGGTITVEEPNMSLIEDTTTFTSGEGISENEADAYLVYQSVREPSLKTPELSTNDAPHKIVFDLFKPGEIQGIAKHLMKMAGYSNESVRTVDKIKN